MQDKNIVILGGGFGGVRVALELAKSQLDGYKIILVDKKKVFSFHTILYEIASAYLPRERKLDFRNLAGTANISLDQIFEDSEVEVINKEVVGVNLKNQQIFFVGRDFLNYSYLVFALGSKTEYYNIPGAQDHSFEFKSTEDALNLRNSIEELLYQKDKNEKIEIVIAGGGSTGCELAAELTGFLDKLAKKHNIKSENVNISIIEASDSLLGAASNWFKTNAQKRLNQLGVEIIFSCAVKKVETKKVITKNSVEIDFDILVWTAGVRAPELLNRISNLPLEEKKDCIKVNNNLIVQNYSNVFAIGDNSFCFKATRGYPQTAQVANAQAKTVAKNIARSIKGEGESLIAFVKQSHPFIVPLGGKYALADLVFIKLTGILGWLMKKVVELKYLLTILSIPSAIKLWLKGLVIYQYND